MKPDAAGNIQYLPPGGSASSNGCNAISGGLPATTATKQQKVSDGSQKVASSHLPIGSKDVPAGTISQALCQSQLGRFHGCNAGLFPGRLPTGRIAGQGEPGQLRSAAQLCWHLNARRLARAQ